MKRLIFFSKKEKDFKVIGPSLAANFAAFLLKNKNIDVEFCRNDSINFKFLEELYLPKRLSKYFNLTNQERIKFHIISDEFIISISNILQNLKKYISQKEHNKLKNILEDNKKRNGNFFQFLDKNFSKILNKIIEAIFIQYKIYNYNELPYYDGITVLKDFFSENYKISLKFLKNFFANTDFENIKFVNYEKTKENIFFLKKIVLKIEDPIFYDFWPESVVILQNNIKGIIEKVDNKLEITILNGEDKDFLMVLNDFKKELEFSIEKNLLKDYRVFLTMDGDCMGKFAFFPYNLYTYFHSIEKILGG